LAEFVVATKKMLYLLIDCNRQAEGKSLEKNQLEKLSKEAELLAELEKLKVK
jgi:uncharacterized protein with WD repeat